MERAGLGGGEGFPGADEGGEPCWRWRGRPRIGGSNEEWAETLENEGWENSGWPEHCEQTWSYSGTELGITQKLKIRKFNQAGNQVEIRQRQTDK